LGAFVDFADSVGEKKNRSVLAHVSGLNLQRNYGAPGRIRTHDPLVRSQVLYPTELRALELINFCFRELLRNYIRLIESEVKELEHSDNAPLIFRIVDRRAGKWEEFKAVNLILPIRNFFPLAPVLS
jgi:hypothetical protein